MGKVFLSTKLCFNYCLILHVLQGKEVLFRISALLLVFSDLQEERVLQLV